MLGFPRAARRRSSPTAYRDLWDNHARSIGSASACSFVCAGCFLFETDFLTLLLMGQNLFLVLLEAYEVKVQIFDTILFKQVLSDQACQVDTCLSESTIFV